MSNDFKVPHPAEEPSDQPTDLTIGELATFTPAQRSAVQYETRIKHLREEVAMYREESRVLKEELNTELKFRENHADLKRGKIEMTIQLAVVTMLSGIGGLLMGVFPRVIGSTPYQFWIGSSLVGVGVFLGIVVTPLTLVICYVWPKLSLSKKQ